MGAFRGFVQFIEHHGRCSIDDSQLVRVLGVLQSLTLKFERARSNITSGRDPARTKPTVHRVRRDAHGVFMEQGGGEVVLGVGVALLLSCSFRGASLSVGPCGMGLSWHWVWEGVADAPAVPDASPSVTM